METKIIQEFPYEEYLAWLDAACEKTREDSIPRILICSHPKVLTMGRGDRQNKDFDLTSNVQGTPVVKINRGGGLTFHAHNQVILYPVIKLNARFGLNEHLCTMAQALQKIVNTKLELEYRRNPLGLWHGQNKLASIGVELRRFVTAHGLAFNLEKIPFDQSLFNTLNPCGLNSKTYSSLSDFDISIPWQQFATELMDAYTDLLKTKL